MLTQNEKQTNTTKTIHLKLTGRKDIDHEECADIVWDSIFDVVEIGDLLKTMTQDIDIMII